MQLLENVGGINTIWFTSLDGSVMGTGYLLTNRKLDGNGYEVNANVDAYAFFTDTDLGIPNLACFDDNCFIKSSFDSLIETYQTCKFNYQYLLIDSFSFEGRSCRKCDFSRPISFGFYDKSCKACSDIKSILQNSSDLIKIVFN